MDTVLANAKGLPNFSRFKPEELKPAIESLIASNKSTIETLLKNTKDYTWDNLVQPLEEMEDTLGRVWSPASHMNSVVNSDELREAYNECLPLLTDYGTDLSQNQKLYAAYQHIAESEDFSSLGHDQKISIEHALRDFHLAGVDLPEEKKQRYREISQSLSKLTTHFEENL